jgi:ribosomal 30S subunit maturation factor RimM
VRVQVGRVGKPHGLEGAFVVEQASEDPERFAEGASLIVGGEPARIVESKRAGGRPVIRLDRDAARGDAIESTGTSCPSPRRASTTRSSSSASKSRSPAARSSAA